MWVIIKLVKNEGNVKLPVIILDENDEIWEFSSEEEASRMRKIFQENSDSGHEYIIKKL
jgi:hypothetical protein